MKRQILLLSWLLWLSPWSVSVVAQSNLRLDDVTAKAGIDFKHFSGGTGQHFIVETVTSGIASFDYDSDGLIDVYLLSGAPLLGSVVEPTPRCRLFRNLGNFQFTDVTDKAGASLETFALGVAAGDYDNDGDPDLFVSNFGPAVLLQNNGEGTFTQHTFQAPAGPPRVGAGISLVDVDADGLLDAYFANYIRFSFDKRATRTIFGVRAAPGPKDYLPDTHTLLRNNGSGGFEDVSEQVGLLAHPGPGMGTVAFDFDHDRDTDLFVCNDSAANFLFENRGPLKWAEIGLVAGVAYDVRGAQQANMGADVADFDGDGHLDLVTTCFINEMPTLYKNSGAGYFDDIAASVGLGVASRNVTWGVGFSDFDNDTWPDLFIASGHLIADISRVNDTQRFAAPNLVLQNRQGKKFVDVTKNSGSAAAAQQVSRGIAIDDFDNDGLNDVIVLNLNDHPQVIRNRTSPAGNYLQLQLIGVQSNRDAVGSRVIVTVGKRQLVQEVIAGRGYQSHFGTRLSFGLGSATQADQIEVEWHGGATERFGSTAAGQLLLLRQTINP